MSDGRPVRRFNILFMCALIIGYDDEQFPADAVCSDCGKEMPLGQSTEQNAERALEWFKAMYLLHLREEHGTGIKQYPVA
jgi:hypothetical protein